MSSQGEDEEGEISSKDISFATVKDKGHLLRVLEGHGEEDLLLDLLDGWAVAAEASAVPTSWTCRAVEGVVE